MSMHENAKKIISSPLTFCLYYSQFIFSLKIRPLVMFVIIILYGMLHLI